MKRPLLAVVFTLIAANAVADSCGHTDKRELQVPLDGARRVHIHAYRGYLQVTGENSTTVQAEGAACANREAMLEEVQLKSRREGTTLHIETVMPEASLSWLGAPSESWLDLRVRVPSSVEVTIDDTSGDMRVADLGATTINDGSGSIEVKNSRGPLRLTDGSGQVHISGIGGDLTVSDDSGELIIRNVSGNLAIPFDGSGRVSIEDVKGNVHVREDGSGEMHIKHVGGDVQIDTDGSGDIYVAEVKRNVRIRDDGSGEIAVESVEGSLDVQDDGSGGVRFRRITGSVHVPD